LDEEEGIYCLRKTKLIHIQHKLKSEADIRNVSYFYLRVLTKILQGIFADYLDEPA
jgi:hypothetical protein